MPFNSTLYLVFLAGTVCLYWVIPERHRVFALIAFGGLFYAYAGLPYLLLLGGLGGASYSVGLLIERDRERWKLLFGVCLLALVLTFFKYAGAVTELLHAGGWDLMLPLGISFYTFELIHYLVEIYRGNIRNPKPDDFLAFLLFFPTRVSGPIRRFPAFTSQLKDIRFKPEYLLYGVTLLVLGYAQKIIIADPLVPFTQGLQDPTVLSALEVLARLYAYSIRIYADFGGLTNIAMGSALLFGVLVPRNFNYPYLRPNISLFWRSWHMSLSNWVRDYLYIPLGGNRHGEWRTALHLLIAMFVIGIWHGSSLNFAVWGLWHGVGLMVNRWWRLTIGRSMPSNWFMYVLGVIITFHFVTIGWALFVTDSLGDSLIIFYKILPYV
ncbi:MBOAT family protein [Candidatus Peregrinibacteria bacterium]|nr:MBOAT family protein [Candidatus Peregrinibacteria bacterium]